MNLEVCTAPHFIAFISYQDLVLIQAFLQTVSAR